MSENRKIAVLGAGEWGSALALRAVRNGHVVHSWARNPSTSFAHSHGLNFKITADIRACLENAHAILFAVKFQAFEDVLRLIRPFVPTQTSNSIPFIQAGKGISQSSFLLGHEIIEKISPHLASEYVVLSGPSFAREVIADLPTALSVASQSSEAMKLTSDIFGGPHMRIYPCSDVTGVEICGAIKNILAIAAGIADGCGLGENARAALITLGLNEIAQLVSHFGGQTATVHSLAGIGDIMLTASSRTSRNMALGYVIGQENCYKPKDEVLTEGVWSTAAIVGRLSLDQVNLDNIAPICSAVYNILHQGVTPQSAIAKLLSRPQPLEHN